VAAELVMRESAEFASAVAADVAGVPHVRVSIGVTLVEESTIAIAAPALENVARG
jgi:hypothetical protein